MWNWRKWLNRARRTWRFGLAGLRRRVAATGWLGTGSRRLRFGRRRFTFVVTHYVSTLSNENSGGAHAPSRVPTYALVGCDFAEGGGHFAQMTLISPLRFRKRTDTRSRTAAVCPFKSVRRNAILFPLEAAGQIGCGALIAAQNHGNHRACCGRGHRRAVLIQEHTDQK